MPEDQIRSIITFVAYVKSTGASEAHDHMVLNHAGTDIVFNPLCLPLILDAGRALISRGYVSSRAGTAVWKRKLVGYTAASGFHLVPHFGYLPPQFCCWHRGARTALSGISTRFIAPFHELAVGADRVPAPPPRDVLTGDAAIRITPRCGYEIKTPPRARRSS